MAVIAAAIQHAMKKDCGMSAAMDEKTDEIPGVILISIHYQSMTADNKSRKSMDFVPLPPVFRIHFPPEFQGKNEFEVQAGEEQKP